MNAPFRIIRNVPPLERARTYPFPDMEVGDAFDAPRDLGKCPRGCDRRQKSINSAACNWARRNNPSARFTTSLIDENTVRCRRDA